MSVKKINEVFSCDKIINFIKSAKQILPYRGYSESKFFLCEIGGVEFLTKLSFYKKATPEIYSSDKHEDIEVINPHDAEIGILRILKRRIIDENISPCVLEMVFCKKCSNMDDIVPDQAICDKYLTNKPVSSNMKDIIYSMFCRHMDLVNSGLAHSNFSFLVLEECDITFHDYMKRYMDNNPTDMAIFTSLMFQLIYTVYAISKIYPEFRHADLHTENVMLKFDEDYEFDMNSPKFLLFYVDGEKYYVPYFGIICKIIDFGFASIPEENIKSYASEDRQLMFMRTNNDLLFFLYDVYETAGKNSTIAEFLSLIEPNETFKHYNTSFIRRNEVKIPSYESMVKNKIFSSYKRTDIKKENVVHEYAKKNNI